MPTPVLTVRVNVLGTLNFGLVESVTVTITLLVPAADGVPEMVPAAGSIVKPLGRPVADQVYGVVPPLAAIGEEYATPAVPPLSEAVVMDSAPAMVIGNVFCDERWVGLVESVTVTTMLAVPALNGVPAIVPATGSIV